MIDVQKLQQQIAPAKLLVVTKTRSVRQIRAVMESGVQYLGENTLQEIQEKYDHQLFRELQQKGVELHYIGHLQTNKIRKIVRLCDAIQSVDSLEKAEKVDQVAAELKKIMPIYIELNLTGEEQKHGINLSEGGVRNPRPPSGEDIDPRLQEMISSIQKLSNIRLLGFMCIGKKDDAEKTREVFRWCKKLADQFGLPEISMGMSQDYKIAVEEGSTMVRLGRGLFE